MRDTARTYRGERHDGVSTSERAVGRWDAPDAARERAVLVAVGGDDAPWGLDDSLSELEALAASADLQVVARLSQRLPRPHPRSYVGSGKLEELKELRAYHQADVVVCDDELPPRVQRVLEEELGCKVVDRTLLILDIFARRARTSEGRAQVELAQYEYLLPRLVGKGTALSRLGGGIGTRGPGETKLEFDRRRIRDRIAVLKRSIEDIRRQRAVHRGARRREELPVVALVGYTNVGKSTLLNALAGGGALVADQLFATLDPLTRRVRLPSGQEVLLSDTVGFIAKLPTTLVAAFRATLEELAEASLLIHVVDVTDPLAAERSAVVQTLLRELGLHEKPVITVLNKVDALASGRGESPDGSGAVGRGAFDTVLISAARGWGLPDLLSRIEEVLNAERTYVEVCVPFDASELVDLFFRKGRVEYHRHSPDGTVIHGRLPYRYYHLFAPYRTTRGRSRLGTAAASPANVGAPALGARSGG
ncbi:MAG TPA: GTPase HflX [Chloroflexota bacterium]